MNNFEKPINLKTTSSIEYQTLNDVKLEEVGDQNNAEYVVNVEPDTSKSEIEEKVKNELERRFWWFKKEWQEKGRPKEQIEIVSGDAKLSIFNFGETLNEEQVSELQNAFNILQSSLVKDNIAHVPYCLISNESEINSKTNEDLSGLSPQGLDAIVLYPRALSQKEHRIPGVPNLEGTFFHEYGHILIDKDRDFKKEWIEKFGWEKNYEQSQGFYINVRPELVPNSYALSNPDEDICDSLVAAAKNSASIDSVRAEFIKSHWLGEDQKENSTAEIKTGSEIKLPSIKSFKYAVIRRKSSTFKMGTVVKAPKE